MSDNSMWVIISVVSIVLLASLSAPAIATKTPIKTENKTNTTEDINVSRILQKAPNNVDKETIDKLSANLDSLSGEKRRKAEEWLLWAAGGKQPQWSDVIKSTGENVVAAERVEQTPKVYQQIRKGMWVTAVEWRAQNDTAIVSIYSKYETNVAFADANDFQSSESTKITVTNARVQADAITRIRVRASAGGGQAVVLNSFENADGADELRAVLLTNRQESSLIPSGTKDIIAIALGALAGVVAIIVAHLIRQRKIEDSPEEVI